MSSDDNKNISSEIPRQVSQSFVALLCVLAVWMGDTPAYAPEAQQPDATQEQEARKIPNDQLDALASPIALYPDPLLSPVLVIALQTGRSFQDTLDLFNKRLEAGYASGLETARAEAPLANVRAQVPDLQRQITPKRIRLSCCSEGIRGPSRAEPC